MTVYEKLSRRPALFRNLTGMSIKEFAALYQPVVDDLERDEERGANHQPGSARWERDVLPNTTHETGC